MSRLRTISLDILEAMSSLPSAETPLERHSLTSLEAWLQQLGAERLGGDPCQWMINGPCWTAEIQLEQEDLRVTWERDGARSQRCFRYRLCRSDVEAGIWAGP
ncbi:MAG TPA: DUF3143 domain-containing protein [Prochlorococcaceae cyanobacterium Fu_MAG_50]|nr:DUF3143 domain-containing protein [Prochlorococcaceae cyanobacterium Fu_MAG_50]